MSAVKVQALFGKASAKKAPKKSVAKTGGKSTAGWFGGAGGAESLESWYGADRKLFLPSGLYDRSEVPSYLTGELPGDYGYDPLGLGKDADALEKYQENELIHARWAMLAAAGIIIPEGLETNGANIIGGTWFETGSKMLNGGTLNWAIPPFAIVSNPLPLFAVVAINAALLGAVEIYRRNRVGPASGYAPGVGKFDGSIFDGLDPLYPGGPFDPLGLSDDPEVLAELKVKEIKNGRLAMISVLGFAVQGLVTKEGPYNNWAKHVADPFGYNLLTILGDERAPTL